MENYEHEFVTTKEAAQILQKSEGYVKKLRMARSGPPYYKIGKSVLYKRDELTAWVESSRVSA